MFGSCNKNYYFEDNYIYNVYNVFKYLLVCILNSYKVINIKD